MIKTHDLKIIHDIEYIKKYSKVVLWGTSGTGNRIYQLLKILGVSVNAFCETHPKQEKFQELPVYSPQVLSECITEEELLIVIASVYVNEIIECIDTIFSEKISVITYLGLEIAVDANIQQMDINYTEKKIYETRKKLEVVRREMGYQQDTRNLDLDHLFALYEDPKSILIYQPGKVGSSSIYKSLSNAGISTIHLHRLVHKENLFPCCSDEYNQLMNEIKKNKIKIITGVREPIGRDLSSFMHHLGDGRWYTYSFFDRDINKTFEKVVEQYFICKDGKKQGRSFRWLDISWNEGKYGQEFEWFDAELCKVFGVDIYRYPFDREKGYEIIKQGNIEIFLYKLEKLSDIWQELQDFVGKGTIKLINDNVSTNKKYYYFYQEFLEQLSLKKEYVDFYYVGNKKMRHFYSEKEVQYFYEKWKARIKG